MVICLERDADCLHGPADATAIPKPRRLLPNLNPDCFYRFGTDLPRLSWTIGQWQQFLGRRSWTMERRSTWTMAAGTDL